MKNKDNIEVQLNKNLNKEINFDDKIVEDKQIKNKINDKNINRGNKSEEINNHIIEERKNDNKLEGNVNEEIINNIIKTEYNNKIKSNLIDITDKQIKIENDKKVLQLEDKKDKREESKKREHKFRRK